MTVEELRQILSKIDGTLPVGAMDAADETCEIQFAGLTCDDKTGSPFFLIHPNGGFLLFETKET